MIKVRQIFDTHLVFAADGTGRFGLYDYGATKRALTYQLRPSPPPTTLTSYQIAAQRQLAQRLAAEERVERRSALSVVSSQW